MEWDDDFVDDVPFADIDDDHEVESDDDDDGNLYVAYDLSFEGLRRIEAAEFPALLWDCQMDLEDDFLSWEAFTFFQISARLHGYNRALGRIATELAQRHGSLHVILTKNSRKKAERALELPLLLCRALQTAAEEATRVSTTFPIETDATHIDLLLSVLRQYRGAVDRHGEVAAYAGRFPGNPSDSPDYPTRGGKAKSCSGLQTDTCLISNFHSCRRSDAGLKADGVAVEPGEQEERVEEPEE
jgi:hypothetical protein